MISHKARVFIAGQTKCWTHLQNICKPRVAELPRDAEARRRFFRTGVIGALRVLQLFPARLNYTYDSIITAANGTKSFDGLESLFISCLFALSAAGDHARFSAGVELWKKLTNSAANTSALDSGVFLDLSTNTLSVLTVKTLQSLKTGGANVDLVVRGSSKSLKKLAIANIPLQAAGTGNATATLSADTEADFWENLALFTVAVVGLALAPEIAGAYTIGALVADVAGGVAAGDAVGHLYQDIDSGYDGFGNRR